MFDQAIRVTSEPSRLMSALAELDQIFLFGHLALGHVKVLVLQEHDRVLLPQAYLSRPLAS
jgi:hypothetical protein